MKDIQYPVRTMRLSDDVWNELKTAQTQSGKSWNLFIKELIKNGDERIYNLSDT